MRTRRWAFVLGCLPALAASPVLAADPFSGVVSAITTNARTWAGALMVVGLLGAGGSIMMGSHQSGTHARNVLFGSIFLLLAGAGVAAFSKIESLLGGGL